MKRCWRVEDALVAEPVGQIDALLARVAVDAVLADAAPDARHRVERELVQLARVVAPTVPTRLRSPSEKPPNTKPPLRPEAPKPIASASSSTTSVWPRSISDMAVARPAKPPPMMQTAHSLAPSSAG